ncbi:RecQ family ATP-dependent DNA helicase [Liquorilactobacillus mali]|uniref:RecQ family ATP-dependent DNA helicase n=1 Tax=Liquorilactobacillus mali TaxID=1618 RepID=UPI000704E747|nr:RecQ family ATP-dependent DNA helicase [Liquorilactobacillus mali]MDN7144684.1 RecQ family ATP-dependent DNA helicase [Liquorilactobacillus mali]
MNNLQLNQLLKQYFGYSEFKKGQIEIIKNLLANNSTLGILPTGTGKSLCYQLTGKIIKKTVLIISPLLSLMNDQVEQLKYSGEKKVVALTSELSYNEKNFILNNIASYSFIYVSPEMLKNDKVALQLSKIDIGLLVVDEAHCISQWGPDFRPDYLRIKNFRKLLHCPLTLALTATATSEVAQDIKANLFDSSETPHVIRYSVDRPNIFLAVHESPSSTEKNRYLIELISQLNGPGLIYFSSKKQADRISEMIRIKTNLRAASYHADLSVMNRYTIQHQFMENQLDIVCATSAFGMGINKQDVRYVIHYHLPSDLSSYVQEIGRAGRDGKRSIAVLLYSKTDIGLQQQLSIDSLPDDIDIDNFNTESEFDDLSSKGRVLQYYFDQNIKTDKIKAIFSKRRKEKLEKLNVLLRYITDDGCRRKYLLKSFGENVIPEHNERCCQLKGEQLNLNEFKFEKKEYKKDSLVNYRVILESFFKT